MAARQQRCTYCDARAARSIKPYTVVKQLVTVVIGIIVGLLAVSLTLATEGVTTWKNHRVRAIIHANAFAPRPTLGFALGVLFHMGFSGALALAGAGVVRARRRGRRRAALGPCAGLRTCLSRASGHYSLVRVSRASLERAAVTSAHSALSAKLKELHICAHRACVRCETRCRPNWPVMA